MSPSELEAFLAEMEQDIRAADRDLREIELLERKNVTAAGRLPEYEALKPRLEALVQAHEEDLHLASQLEKRIAGLMDRYATNVSYSRDFSFYDLTNTIGRWTCFRSYLLPGTTRYRKLKTKSGDSKETTKK